MPNVHVIKTKANRFIKTLFERGIEIGLELSHGQSKKVHPYLTREVNRLIFTQYLSQYLSKNKGLKGLFSFITQNFKNDPVFIVFVENQAIEQLIKQAMESNSNFTIILPFDLFVFIKQNEKESIFLFPSYRICYYVLLITEKLIEKISFSIREDEHLLKSILQEFLDIVEKFTFETIVHRISIPTTFVEYYLENKNVPDLPIIERKLLDSWNKKIDSVLLENQDKFADVIASSITSTVPFSEFQEIRPTDLYFSARKFLKTEGAFLRKFTDDLKKEVEMKAQQMLNDMDLKSLKELQKNDDNIILLLENVFESVLEEKYIDMIDDKLFDFILHEYNVYKFYKNETATQSHIMQKIKGIINDIITNVFFYSYKLAPELNKLRNLERNLKYVFALLRPETKNSNFFQIPWRQVSEELKQYFLQNHNFIENVKTKLSEKVNEKFEKMIEDKMSEAFDVIDDYLDEFFENVIKEETKRKIKAQVERLISYRST